jgi:hypothetical protein
VLTGRRAGPGSILTDSLGLWKEVKQRASVELLLKLDAAIEELLSSRLEVAMENRKECKCLGRQDFLVGAC